MKLAVAAAAIGLAFGPGIALGKEAALWERYKKTFVSPDGRVIDFQQGEASHSEGQGYSMLLAVDYGDREAFNKIWSWTSRNLAVRSDGLLAWLWGRRVTGAWGVIDYNNATDGDVLAAMALIKAGDKWGDPELTKGGVKLARAVRENLIVTRNDRSYLLPGYFGFVFNGGFVLNPSYQALSAYRLFARADAEGAHAWNKIYADAKYLIHKSQFGEMQMTADWVAVDERGAIRLHADKSPYSGKEAVRVFLYASNDSASTIPSGLGPMLAFYEKRGYIPLQVNVLAGEASLAQAPGGFYAAYAKAAAAAGNDAAARKLFKTAREALEAEDKNYYSMALYMLATSEEAL